jgi:hypothetical protein
VGNRQSNRCAINRTRCEGVEQVSAKAARCSHGVG